MILKGKKVVLRPIEFEDLEFIRSMINSPEIEKTIIGWALPVSRKDEEKWYANFANTQQTIRYVIETYKGEIVGLISLGNIDMKNGCAKDFGIRIDPNVQSNGLATDATMTMFNYAFCELRLHRIETAAFVDNIASIRFQEKCGCRQEGVKREAIYKEGKYKDVVTFGCLKEEFLPIYHKYTNQV